jgi:HSP20 family molecular chaperone IbpA
MNGLALRNRNRGISSIFDDFLTDNWFSNYQSPAIMDWDEEGNNGVITIEAPGFTKDDVKIETNSDGIVITGELKDESLKNRLKQCSFSYILRRSDLDPKNIEAKLENGVLTIGVSKSKDKVSRLIPIQ